jgi:hypothetical protein
MKRKQTSHKLLLGGIRCIQRNNTRAAIVAAILTLVSANLRATLPEIPSGVSVLNTQPGDKGLRQGILDNPDVDMISIADDWSVIQKNADTYDWTYADDTIDTIAAHGKSVLLRMPSMGGSEYNGGKTPNWVFQLMPGVDYMSTTAVPGTTYSFFDSDSMTLRCIPVFWQPVYLAKKKALLAMAGAHFSNIANKDAVKIVGVSYANAITEDWNIPNDKTGSPSEVELWLNDPSDPVVPGAGYTTQKMIDAAIHQGDASFTDGVVTGGTALTSLSATFTQADIGCLVTGRGYRPNTHIIAWISPTQVTLDQRASRKKGARFTIVARRDGLIDVAMAAFPNQYITGAVSGNGPDLDADFVPEGEDPGTYLAKSVDNMAQDLYHERYIVQRNNVSAIIPLKQDDDGSTAWTLLAEAADRGFPTAGQALGTCYNNDFYRMNGGDGNNCDHDNLSCDFPHPPCELDCALDYGQILQRSFDHLATYSPSYYEIYPPDAGNLKPVVSCIHNLLHGEACSP